MRDGFGGFLPSVRVFASGIEALAKDGIEKHPEVITSHSWQVAEQQLKQVFIENCLAAPKTNDLLELIDSLVLGGLLSANHTMIEAALYLQGLAPLAMYPMSPIITSRQAARAIECCNLISESIRFAGYGAIPIRVDAHLLREEDEPLASIASEQYRSTYSYQTRGTGLSL